MVSEQIEHPVHQTKTFATRCGAETWYLPKGGDAWVPGQCILTVKPDWIGELIDSNDGAFWAPSLLDNRNMVYSVPPGGGGGGTSCLGWVKYGMGTGWFTTACRNFIPKISSTLWFVAR